MDAVFINKQGKLLIKTGSIRVFGKRKKREMVFRSGWLIHFVLRYSYLPRASGPKRSGPPQNALREVPDMRDRQESMVIQGVNFLKFGQKVGYNFFFSFLYSLLERQVINKYHVYSCFRKLSPGRFSDKNFTSRCR